MIVFCKIPIDVIYKCEKCGLQVSYFRFNVANWGEDRQKFHTKVFQKAKESKEKRVTDACMWCKEVNDITDIVEKTWKAITKAAFANDYDGHARTYDNNVDQIPYQDKLIV